MWIYEFSLLIPLLLIVCVHETAPDLYGTASCVFLCSEMLYVTWGLSLQAKLNTKHKQQEKAVDIRWVA